MMRQRNGGQLGGQRETASRKPAGKPARPHNNGWLPLLCKVLPSAISGISLVAAAAVLAAVLGASFKVAAKANGEEMGAKVVEAAKEMGAKVVEAAEVHGKEMGTKMVEAAEVLALSISDASDSFAFFSGAAGVSPGRQMIRNSESEARRTGHLFKVRPDGTLRQ